MKPTHLSMLILGVALLTPGAFACDAEGPPARVQAPPESRPMPKESCERPCLVMRVSTHCECSLRGARPAST